jgi:hypothetical protein
MEDGNQTPKSKRGGARPGAGRKPAGVAPKRKKPKRKFAPLAKAAPVESSPSAPPKPQGFQPGQSGNPGGRPKGYADVRAAAREYTQDAIDRLVFWMNSDNAKASVGAAVAILNRGWGMPQQNIKTTIRDMRAMTDAELYGFLAGDEQGGGGEGASASEGDTRVTH